MAKPVQPHAWGKAPIQLALGRLGRPRPARRDRACEIAVARVDDRLHSTLTVLPARACGQSDRGPAGGQTVAADTPVTCRMTSPLATSAAAPSPTNVEPCMAANMRGRSAARLASCRFVFSVYGT